jgi:hypothetical protein
MRTLLVPIVAIGAFGIAGCTGSGPAPVDPETGERTAATFAKSFGGPAYDGAVAAIPASDGGSVFVGYLDGFIQYADGQREARDSDVWIVKLDANGEVEWQRNFGDRPVSPGNGSSVTLTSPMRRTPDGGLIVGGSEWRNRMGAFRVLKLNAAGHFEWAQSYPSGGWLNYEYIQESAREPPAARDWRVGDIAPIDDGGYWVVGSSTGSVRKPAGSFEGDDVYSPVPPGNAFIGAESQVVMRLDAQGNLRVLRRFTEGQFQDNALLGRALIRSDARGNGFLVRQLGGFDQDADRNVSLLIDLLDETGRSVASRSFGREERTAAYPTVIDAIRTDDVVDGSRDGVADDGFVVLYSDDTGTILQKFSRAPGTVLEWEVDVTGPRAGLFQAVAQRCRPDAQFGQACDFVLGGFAQTSGERQALIALVSSTGELLGQRALGDLSPRLTSIEALRAQSPDRLLVLGAFDVPDGFVNSGRRLELGPDLLPIAGTAVSFDRVPPQYGSIIGRSLGRNFDAKLDPQGSFILSYLGEQQEGYHPHAADATPMSLAPDLQGDEWLLRREWARGVAEVSRGAFVVVGQSTFDGAMNGSCFDCVERQAWLLRIESGRVVWQHRYTGLGADADNSMAAVAASGDGGFVALTGGRRLLSWPDSWRLVKFDGSGVPQKQTPILFIGSPGSEALRAVPGGFLVSNHEDAILLLDEQLNVVWHRTFTLPTEFGLGPSSRPVSFDAVDEDRDGERDDGFVVLARPRASTAPMELRRLDRNGELLWMQRYDTAAASGTLAQRVRATADGFIVGATTNRTVHQAPTGNGLPRPMGEHNITLYKLTADRAIEWQRSYGALHDEYLNSLEALPDGGVLIGGNSTSLGDSSEAWILRLGPDGRLSEGCHVDLGTFDALPIFRVSAGSVDNVALPAPAADDEQLRFVRELAWVPREEAIASARQCLGNANPVLPPPPPGQLRLSVVQAGERAGPVTSVPQGIACGTGGTQFCSADFAAGTRVVLTADFTGFVRWDSDLCDEDEPPHVCAVTLDADLEIPVVFRQVPSSFTLTVTMPGAAPTARIVSDPIGIDCTTASNADCSSAYTSGTVVRLRATGSEFVSWQGCTPVAGETRVCEVTMDENRSVVATL